MVCQSESSRLLDVIDIAEPCQIPWDSMTGDERIRFCGMCKKNVYNISEMNRTDAENFLQENLGAVCLTFLRRADGTIVTDSCPRILKPVRDGFLCAKKLVFLVLGTLISASAALAQGESTPLYTKEQCAALAAGRFGETKSRARLGGFIPNIYRLEEPHLRALTLQELTSGEFRLSDSEVYIEKGKIFINEELKIPQPNLRGMKLRRNGASIDGCTVSSAFKRGKEWVARGNDRIAESYFKLALKITLVRYLKSETETPEIVRQYAALLKRTGRKAQANSLLKSDVAISTKKVLKSSILGFSPKWLTMSRLTSQKDDRLNQDRIKAPTKWTLK